MTIKTSGIMAAVALAACGNAGISGSQAQQKAPAARLLDVAGVRIGMAAGAARAALERGGWKVDADAGHDWNEEVAYEIARQRSGPEVGRSGTKSLNATKGDEFVTVQLHPVPAGAIVSAVSYAAPLAGRTYDHVRAEMIARYGTPGYASPAPTDIVFARMAWCTGGERCQNAYGAAKQALGVQAQGGTKLVVSLNEGSEAERAWRAALASAVRARAGTKSSF